MLRDNSDPFSCNNQLSNSFIGCQISLQRLIDSTHVGIVSPPGLQKNLYKNRKEYYSVNVKAVRLYTVSKKKCRPTILIFKVLHCVEL